MGEMRVETDTKDFGLSEMSGMQRHEGHERVEKMNDCMMQGSEERDRCERTRLASETNEDLMLLALAARACLSFSQRKHMTLHRGQRWHEQMSDAENLCLKMTRRDCCQSKIGIAHQS